MSNLTRRRETGAILVLKVPTGALKRRKRILTREPRDNKDLCLSKDNKKTGVIEVSILINGAMRKSREERVRRLLMINLYTRDQPRLLGKFLEKLHQSMTGKSHTLLLSKESKRKTGAILVSREPTGAPRRRPRILMRGLRDNKDLCSSRDSKRTGVIEVSTLTNGAMMKSLEEKVRRPSMINLFTRDQPRLPGKLMEPTHQSMTGKSHTSLLSKERETGAIPESKEPTGAPRRRPRILMRGLRDNKDLCSSRDNKRTGATEVSTPINGATRRSREERVRRPLMINLSTKDQPRLLGKFLGKLHQSTTGNNHIPYPNKPHNLLLTEETGATLALRELTGALLRRPLT